MAYISTFTYCDTIQTELTPQGPRHQIMNPLQALAPISIPGNFSFSIACNIVGFDSSLEHCMKLVFLTPEGTELYNSGDVKFQMPPEQVKANALNGIQFNVDIRNLVLRDVGLYSTKVFFDEDELGEYKIQVLKGEY